jgi:UDPglucose 6-dehydrogenase
VGTPQNEDGSCNLNQLYSVVSQISDMLSNKTILVIKSTVPIGTTRKIQKILIERHKKSKVLFVPEFLSQNTALQNAMFPSRVIIGGEDEISINFAKSIFAKNSISLTTSWESAEMIKYASNAFLATKISFINEISILCQATSANIEDVARGMGMDKRIGKDFLQAGIGFGGSCLGKDLQELISVAEMFNIEMEILKSVRSVNEKQKTRIVNIAEKELGR